MLYHIALSLTGRIGPVRYRKLMCRFESPEQVFNASPQQLEECLPASVAALLTDDLLKKAEKTRAWCDRYSIQLITDESESYPAALKEIYNPPFLLYVRGDASFLHRPGVSIVGTRRASSYGKHAAGEIAEAAVINGYTVVSGLAAGIDCTVHRAAVKRGDTVAVLPNGMDRIYPAFHRELAAEIARNGCLVSEFAPGFGGLPYMFLQRNRIISALTKATVIIEAGERSGALSTARHALDQNREVFSLPGSIYVPQSRGTNRLIEQGATPVLGAEELIRDIHAIYRDTGTEVFAPLQQQPTSTVDVSALPEKQRRICGILQNGEKRLDELMEALEGGDDLFGILLEMEMAEIIEQVPGQKYRLNEI
ncbi:MAG: DNA-processing protein DprA [Fibrobacterota bacterium]